jgi:hypothetical protein
VPVEAVVDEDAVNGTNEDTTWCGALDVCNAALGAPEANATNPVFMLSDRDSAGGSSASFSDCTWCCVADWAGAVWGSWGADGLWLGGGCDGATVLW